MNHAENAPQSTSLQPVDDNAAVQALKNDWPKLTPLERGRRLKTLVDSGCSRRRLAGSIGRHESRIRQLVLLTELPPSEQEKLGTRGRGVKKSVAALRKKRASQPRRRKTSKRSEKLKARNARLIAAFVQKEGLPAGPYRQQLFEEMKNGPYLYRAVVFRKAAENAKRTPLAGKAPEIVEKCRPSRPRPDDAPDVINFLVDWFAIWSAYVIPDPPRRYDAVAQAQLMTELSASESAEKAEHLREPL